MISRTFDTVFQEWNRIVGTRVTWLYPPYTSGTVRLKATTLIDQE